MDDDQRGPNLAAYAETGAQMHGTVGVVIPTHNRAALLRPLLTAVLSQEGPRAAEVIVVDDASADGTFDILEEFAASDSRVVPIRLPRQCGPAVARNRGWQASTCPLIAFIDDDCLPRAGWLHHLVTAFEDADVVQGRTDVDLSDGGPGAFGRWIEVAQFSYFYESCNIGYRRELLEDLHGFDEAFGFSRGGAPYGEDTDLGWRAEGHNARCVFAPNATILHPVTRMSFRARARSQLRSARMVYVVRRHPEIRRHLVRRYFLLRSHLYALGTCVGVAAALALPPAIGVPVGLVSAAVYLRFRLFTDRVQGRRRYLPVTIPAVWLLDLLDVVVLSAASIRWRTLLL